MIKHVPVYAVLMFVFCACNGQNKTELRKDDSKPKNKDVIAAESTEGKDEIEEWNKRLKIMHYRSPAVDSETVTQGVIIQNSLPKGAPQTDSRGKTFGVAIFWTRVINESDSALELTINFPVDSLEILSSTDSYLKVFLLSDTMTLDKVPLYNYGVTGLRSLLDTGLNKPTMLQRSIHPKEECLFYVAAVRFQVPGTHRAKVHQGSGVIRTGFVLKEQDLFYKISIDLDSEVIPCGHLVFKK